MQHCWTIGRIGRALYAWHCCSIGPHAENMPVEFGEIQLSDEFSPKYATDGEERLLQLISLSPNNALLWNKLGNLYSTGGRPELAMAAFEKSIAIDPNQLESHYSIANMLAYTKDYQHTIHHFHQMILCAEDYEHLDANPLRELLAHGICTSFLTSIESKQKYPPLPTKEQLIAANRELNLATDELIAGIKLSSDDIASFYPLAEVFMGKRARELH